MSTNQPVILYHAPQSRSSATLTLLEELRAPYELRLVNIKAGEQRRSGYLAINPLGKVPAIQHHGALVTEQVAIYLYLADFFADAALAPAIRDPQRGPYLRWMIYYAACYEPALVDYAMKREPGPPCDVALRRFRHDAENRYGTDCRLDLSAGRCFFGSRPPVGHGAAVGHSVQDHSGQCGHHKLCVAGDFTGQLLEGGLDGC